jgi:hypothetical protein
VSLQIDAGGDAAFGPATYRALIVACLLQLYQQLSGANMTLYFSAALIEKVAGASPVWTAWCAPALCGPHRGIGTVGRDQCGHVEIAKQSPKKDLGQRIQAVKVTDVLRGIF